MPALLSNNATSTLQAGIADSDTSLSVASSTGSLFPVTSGTNYFYVTLVDNSQNREIVKVTTRASDTFTIERGQEGTTARAYSAGDSVSLRMTAAAFNEKLTQEDLTAFQSSVTTPIATSVSDHLADTSDAHDASAVSFSPTGTLASTDVQAAIAELDSEKAALNGDATEEFAVADDAYDAGWSGNTGAARKANVYAEIENVKSSIPAAVTPIGEGQTWQDVSASRAVNTDYTNSTGRPIQVCAAFSNGATRQFTVDGVDVGYIAGADAAGTVQVIVPNGSVYRLDGTGTILMWSELR